MKVFLLFNRIGIKQNEKKNACSDARRGQTKSFYSPNKMCKVTLISVANASQAEKLKY